MLVPVRTDAPDIVENEHVDPEQVAEKEKGGIASRDRCVSCEAGCRIQEASSTT